MSFEDVVKAKKGKKGATPKGSDGANPFAKGGDAKPGAKPSKGSKGGKPGKGGGFKKAVSNAKKKCKGKC